jgi:hypothetical protein
MGTGRVYQYVSDAEARQIRTEAEKLGRPALFERMGIKPTGAGHWHALLSGKDRITVAAAERFRAGIEGRTSVAVPRERAIVVAKTRGSTAKVHTVAPRKVLEALRNDAARALVGQYGSDVTAFARDARMTTGRLVKFLGGKPIPLESATALTQLIGAAAPAPAPRPSGIEPAVVRARRLVQQFSAEAFSICLQLATEGGAA